MLVDAASERTSLIQADVRKVSTRFTVMSQVTGIIVIAGYVTATQIAKSFFEDYPGFVCILGLTAGGARVLITDFMAPHEIDRRIHEYLTQFDTPLFLALTVAQQVSDSYPPLNSICYPLMYMHEGAVLSWEFAKKWKETKGSHPEFGVLNEMRPLFEGDTRGSIRAFLIKGGGLIVVGGGAAVAGALSAAVAPWRLGLILGGMGASIPCVQPLYSKIGKVMQEYMHTSASERLVMGDIPFKQRLLHLLSRFAPTIGRVGICSTGALLIVLPLALEKIEIRSAFINAGLGLPLALVDVGCQDAFQYPSEVVEEENKQASCHTRVWKDIKKRPSTYVGVAATTVVTGAIVAAQQFNPSLNGPLTASLILGSAATSFTTAKGVETFCRPGVTRVKNQINFLLAKRTHIYVMTFLALYDSYLWDALSPTESYVMWGLCGTFIGLFLKEVLD